MRPIHFGPDIIYLGETLGRRPFAGLNKPQSCVEEHIKPKATPLIKRAALAPQKGSSERAKQPVYVVVVVSRKPWVMTFASGTVFPASMKPYSQPASREYVSIPIRISIYMFYEVWFISPYNTRQCDAQQHSHSHTIELEGRKFDNHGLGVWHCFSMQAVSLGCF